MFASSSVSWISIIRSLRIKFFSFARDSAMEDFCLFLCSSLSGLKVILLEDVRSKRIRIDEPFFLKARAHTYIVFSVLNSKGTLIYFPFRGCGCFIVSVYQASKKVGSDINTYKTGYLLHIFTEHFLVYC